jgi:hypothetical protein
MDAAGHLVAVALAGWFAGELALGFGGRAVHAYGELVHRDEHPVKFWLSVFAYLYGLAVVLAANS